MRCFSLVLIVGGCGTGPQPATESDSQAGVEPDPVCAVDGEVPAALSPHESALDTFVAEQALAPELLGGAATWEGDLTGLELDADGLASGDGEIPAVGPDGEGFLARVGWISTWCAAGRQVKLTASRTEAFAECGPVADSCSGTFETPDLDGGDALAIGADSGSSFYDAVLYQPRATGSPVSLAWQAVWLADTSQAFRWVDATNGEILACGDSVAYGCDESAPE